MYYGGIAGIIVLVLVFLALERSLLTAAGTWTTMPRLWVPAFVALLPRVLRVVG